MSPPKTVWLCASNSTHFEMWNRVCGALRRLDSSLQPEVVSFAAYYGGFSKAGIAQVCTCFDLPRSGGHVPYWESNSVQRFFAVVEARQQLVRHLAQSPPDLMVLGNDIGIVESLAIGLARNHQIETLLVQDGILHLRTERRGRLWTAPKSALRALSGMPLNTRYGLGGADKIAVMGSYTRELLLRAGIEPSRIVVTGQPRYDDATFVTPPRSVEKRAQGLTRLGLPADKKVIGLFTQPMVRYGYMKAEQWDRVVQGMLRAASGVRGLYTIVVKLHPADIEREFRARYGALLDAADASVLQGQVLNSLLSVLDLAVVHTSTVALEVIVVGKPLVIFNPWEGADEYGFADLGAALPARTSRELEERMHAGLENGDLARRLEAGRRRAVGLHIGQLDGSASLRVAQQILRMITGS